MMLVVGCSVEGLTLGHIGRLGTVVDSGNGREMKTCYDTSIALCTLAWLVARSTVRCRTVLRQADVNTAEAVRRRLVFRTRTQVRQRVRNWPIRSGGLSEPLQSQRYSRQ